MPLNHQINVEFSCSRHRHLCLNDRPRAPLSPIECRNNRYPLTCLLLITYANQTRLFFGRNHHY